jgi:hypothetical protein
MRRVSTSAKVQLVLLLLFDASNAGVGAAGMQVLCVLSGSVGE